MMVKKALPFCGQQLPDPILIKIADYIIEYKADNSVAREMARYCLMDSLGCAILALSYPSCNKLLGPIVPGATLKAGARVPGTDYQLEPVQAAFNIGAMIRWLDFNDTWLAAEWGHPSDNLGAILAIADYLSRQNLQQGYPALQIGDVITALIKAYEIQGIIALENSFNSVGLDHVLLVRVASTAVVTAMLGGGREHIISALSNAWIDGAALRSYRHYPNTGSRKSWAAGDATSRGVRLALLAIKGEMGYPSVLTAKTWGFYDVLFKGECFELKQEFSSYVVENILFKISFPAEFHGQTAIEAAIQLHPQVLSRLEEIDKVVIQTQRSGKKIIDKVGVLNHPAERDHCLQYMVAVALLVGSINADHYQYPMASDPRITALRKKMVVLENKKFSLDYVDPNKRSIANALQVFFNDGSHTIEIVVEYPLGHKRRREEAIPFLKQKFVDNLATRIAEKNCTEIHQLFADQGALENIRVDKFMDLFVI
jgi:2-methylcitrate dehydratase